MANDYEAERAARVAAVTRPRPEAMAAAKWWVDQLRGGEQGSAGDAFVDAMMSLIPRDALTVSELDRLEAELAAGVEGELVQREEWRRADGRDTGWQWCLGIDVDYGPCTVLAKAAERAGVCAAWPIKTNCTVDRGRVVVRCGYGAGFETVWLSEEGARHWTRVALERCRDELAAIVAASEGLGALTYNNAICALDHVRMGMVWIGGS